MPQPLAKAQLTRHIRTSLPRHVLDTSGAPPVGVALYTLSDLRDVRSVRYVGQTHRPERRFLQHLRSARLWLPDDVPWWVGASGISSYSSLAMCLRIPCSSWFIMWSRRRRPWSDCRGHQLRRTVMSSSPGTSSSSGTRASSLFNSIWRAASSIASCSRSTSAFSARGNISCSSLSA